MKKIQITLVGIFLTHTVERTHYKIILICILVGGCEPGVMSDEVATC